MSQYTTEHISFMTRYTHVRLSMLIHDSVYSFTTQCLPSWPSTWVSTRLSIYHSRLSTLIHDSVCSFTIQYAHSRLGTWVSKRLSTYHSRHSTLIHDWVYIIHDSVHSVTTQYTHSRLSTWVSTRPIWHIWSSWHNPADKYMIFLTRLPAHEWDQTQNIWISRLYGFTV